MANEELAVINSVLKNPNNSVDVLFSPSVDDLFVAYKDVWMGMKDYYARHHVIPDFSVISEQYDIDDIKVGTEPVHYLDRLKEQFITNRINSLLTKADTALNEENAKGPEVLEKLQANLNKLTRFSHSARDFNIMDFDAAERRFEEKRELSELYGVPGIPTGISFIDSAYTSGLKGGDLIVVLGWTGRAKSLFTTLVCCNAHATGRKPMIVSLEMTGDAVQDRVLTIMGSGLFRNSDLGIGNINIDDFRSFKTKNEHLGDFNVVTDDGLNELTPNVIQAKIDQHKPSMLVFDYAQLASDNDNSSDMTARMRNMSKQFKRLAVNNDIPIILISSATPDGTVSMNEPPQVHQVAWSRQLAFDADLAFAVHRHDDSDLIEIVCRKNRNGPLFSGYLEWDIDRGIIEEKFDIA